jgi:FMN phosphatase YigB (HAD superfamily)
MIGDNVVLDLLPAKALGIKTILYSKWVDEFIRDLRELAEFFSFTE